MSALYYIQFIGCSVLIIGLLLVALKYSKQYQNKFLSREIKIIDRVATGSNANVFLLQVKEKTYIIGATNTQINLIDKL